MAEKLSFKEFQATRNAQTWGKAKCEMLGIEGDSAEVLVYDEECYIECCENGMYYLIIGNQDWWDPRLEMLEELLYNHWYC